MIRTEWQAELAIFYNDSPVYNSKYDAANARRVAAEDLEMAKQAFAYAKRMLGKANQVKANDWMLNKREEQSRAMKALNAARVGLRKAKLAEMALEV